MPEAHDQIRTLPSGVRLAIRAWNLDARKSGFLLVHGLASNARMWDGVARRLAEAGHPVVAVDQRGHGASAKLNNLTEFNTEVCAADLIHLAAELGWTKAQRPVLVGQSWGGNVVLTAATEPSAPAAAIALVDGGWLALGRRFSTFEECWAVLAPPVFTGMRYPDLAARIQARSTWPAAGIAGTLANLIQTPEGGVRAILEREHHQQILRSLWAQDPALRYPKLRIPTLLLPAGSPETGPAAAIDELLHAVPSARVRWYPGAHHDLHAQHPAEVATDLLTLVKDLP